MTSAREPLDLLEELAVAVMAARTDDDASLASLADGLSALEAMLGDDLAGSVNDQLRGCKEKLERIRGQSAADPREELDCIRRELAALQELLTHQDDAREQATRDGRFVLPEWVEEPVFLDFIASHESVIEEIGSDMLALEGGSATDVLDDLRGKIHSLKGEAGVLGLDELEEVCHALEDHLEEAFSVDLLLSAKDWLAEALQAYSRRERPSNEEIMTALNDPVREAGESRSETGPEEPVLRGEPGPPEPGAAQQSTQSSGPEEQATGWDEDALEIVGEFMQESDEGLTQVDEILLGAEQQGVDNEQINALFRVFHTIKGVAGFLELEEITELAHTTETMLDRGRSGDLRVEGAVLDLVLDATEMMRRMLEELGRALSQGQRPAGEPELRGLVDRLQAVIQGQLPREEALPEARSEERLGEILRRPPLSVDSTAVEDALKSQKESDRPLGEELLAQKSATPKQVSQALRAQSRAGGKVHTVKEVIRVDLDRVDNLVALIGELVIVESMVVNAPELSGQATPWLRKHLSQMSKITRDLQDIGTRMRMVPVRGVFQKMARMVRDLSRKNGKAIFARMEGESTEMDRSMVEQIADPLVHMIRNAVDHGIEGPAERSSAGKPPQGVITLRAFHQGGSVVIEVSDDGRGLDRDLILNKAREKGVVDDGDKLTDQEVYNLILAPGFSTAEQVTEISGRGVGMDVVRRNIEAIRGRVKIDSTFGRGSTFTMVLPLTLAIIDGMLIACGEERYIIPTLSVLESIRPGHSVVFSVAGKGEIVSLRGETLPLFRLARLLGITDAVEDPTDALVVVVESRGKKLGIMVDDVLTQQQVVIKSLGDGLPNTRYLSGAAIMSDGRVGLILNVDEMSALVDEDTFRPRTPERPATTDGRGIDTAATDSKPDPGWGEPALQTEEVSL
ncbi:MAG: chemotaxis protein CheW [Acidobacteriota bacterium]